MKRFVQPFTLLLALCALGSVAHAKDDGHDKDSAFIYGAYIAVDTAYDNKDADGIVAFLADDWVEIGTDGDKDTDGRKAQRKLISQVMIYATQVTSHTVVENVDFTKEGAIVTYTLDLAITASANGKTTTATNTSMEQDTWVKSGDVWQIKQTKDVTSRGTIDGKPA